MRYRWILYLPVTLEREAHGALLPLILLRPIYFSEGSRSDLHQIA